MAFSKITLGTVASLVLVTTGAASYRTAAIIDLGAYHDAIAELRDVQRVDAEWTQAAGLSALRGPAVDSDVLLPLGARWQERKGALERAAGPLDVPTGLRNELAAYVNALDARAKGVRHFASNAGGTAEGTRAAAWFARAATDNLADRAGGLIGDLTTLVDAKRTTAAWYERGAVVAAVGVVACWILLAATRGRGTMLSAGVAAAWHGARQPSAPASQLKSILRRRAPANDKREDVPAKSHAVATLRLREAMAAQLVAERLQAAAHRINAAAVKLWRSPAADALAANALAARVDDEAQDIADLAARFAAFSRHGGEQRTLVDVAACVDEVVADTDFQGADVSWRSVAEPRSAGWARSWDRARGRGSGRDSVRIEVFAAPTGVRLMLANLLENAVHAVRLARREEAVAPGRVGISCAVENDRAVITVMDDGVGMSAAQRERAFLPFCSGWPTDGPNAMGGIGLAITARLVEAYAGTIALGSLPDGGTVAQITLPVARRQPHDVPELSSTPLSGPPLRDTIPAEAPRAGFVKREQ